jgi:DNA-directed RNA polymerase specialized sigma24 family protein
MNARVAGYAALAESLAQRLVGRNGAEFDDLVQEGLIFAWQSMERGVTPSAGLIEARMKNWVKLLGYQILRTAPRLDAAGKPVRADYPVLLPLDDFPHLTNESVPDRELERLLDERGAPA